MNPEEIKVGDRVLVEAEVTTIYKDGDVGFYTRSRSNKGDILQYHGIAISRDVRRMTPAPKYDPCREFRKGDKVRVVEWNMRSIARIGQIGYVESAENNSRVELSIDGWKNGVFYPACHLELITPVEELEPYVVRLAKPDGVEEWHVEPRNNNLALVAVFGHSHPHAKAAAEAECDRLNAEYRKEQK